MKFDHFTPSAILKPYVKLYFIFESDSDVAFDDIVFPSGDMEMIFNLDDGTWETSVENKFVKTPPIELWGQITKPLPIKSKGRHTMLGIKLHTHSAAYFISDEIGIFNNRVTDLADVIGNPVKILHAQLLETPEPDKRIALVEAFLIKRLIAGEKRAFRIDKVADILSSIKKDPAENSIRNIATKHGITTRYLQRIIYQHTGLSPKSFDKINRFQHSLKLLSKNDRPLTAVAYNSGYFDQSHFIRDFKSFTGVTPSEFLENTTPVNQLLQL
jgi:AraC-like DNA-binding protein